MASVSLHFGVIISNYGNTLSCHTISNYANTLYCHHRHCINRICHYSDVIMYTMSSQITGVSIGYSTICSGADQRKYHITDLCEGNLPVTGEVPAQGASNAENISIWWRHHACEEWVGYIILSFSVWEMFCVENQGNSKNMFFPHVEWCLYYRKISNISRIQSQNLNASRLVLQLPLPNPLKPCVKSRMKL